MRGLSPWACDPARSRGRLHSEERSALRGPRDEYQRDRDRVIHSIPFRRLRHKTQVFVAPDGDHFRVRLTHSLEVAQIGRTIARALGLNEDLTEALCLAHDIGHPPFGHSGEEALRAATEHAGGFDHNAHTLRVLMRIEKPYPRFDGLNLTWETLEGLAKHNGPVEQPSWAMAEANAAFPLELGAWPSLEAQVAAVADDIAYDNHDIDDGLRAGLFTIHDLQDVPLVGPIFAEVASRYPGIEEARTIHESIRRVIDRMVTDLIAESRRRLEQSRARSAAEIRALGRPVIAFSEPMAKNDKALKSFLFERMYRHYRVNRMTSKARRVVQDLFRLLLAEPQCLPEEWRDATDGPGNAGTARVVADYVAGMTDRFALDEHHRLFDTYAVT